MADASDMSVSDQVSLVSAMVGCLDRCGSRVVQSVCLLRRCHLTSTRTALAWECIVALEVLRGLDPEREKRERVWR